MGASQIREKVAALCQTLEKILAEAEKQNPIREIFGTTIATAADSFIFAYFIAIFAIELARRLQAGGAFLNTASIMELGTKWLPAVALGVFWVFVLRRWFRYIGWPKWWAVLYVIFILIPWTWVFSSRVQMGLNSIFLLLLQSPVIVVYVRRVHSLNSERRKSD